MATKLSLDGSPEQIAGWLKREFPDDESRRVSHETLYRSLFIQARGVLKKELMGHLRSGRMMRRAKNASTEGQPRGQIVEGVSVRERPAEVEDRAIPGHWEGDLITGSKNTPIATLVERQSRFTLLVKVQGKDTVSVVGGAEQTSAQTALPTAPLVDLGPRHGDGTSPEIYRCNGRESLLVILRAPGNAGQMKIPTACCASTSRQALTYPVTPSRI